MADFDFEAELAALAGEIEAAPAPAEPTPAPVAVVNTKLVVNPGRASRIAQTIAQEQEAARPYGSDAPEVNLYARSTTTTSKAPLTVGVMSRAVIHKKRKNPDAKQSSDGKKRLKASEAASSSSSSSSKPTEASRPSSMISSGPVAAAEQAHPWEAKLPNPISIEADMLAVQRAKKAAEAKAAQEEKTKARGGKPRTHLRTAAGEVWEDPTLEEWAEGDYRVFCGDLGNEVNDSVLSKLFTAYASFLKAKVVRDKRTQKSKGFGFVSFADPQDCANALRECNGKYCGNRPIKLRRSNWQARGAADTRRNLKKSKPQKKQIQRHLF